MLASLDIFTRRDWQMAPGTRAALEGLLTQLQPALAVEIGTAQGGSLERIAAHSGEVHAIDLTGELLRECPPNATFHAGDSREVLPRLLAGFANAGRNVDFALVDGDHEAAGVRADLEALLASPAVRRTVILVHDSFNPAVRDGIRSVERAAHPKVAAIELDFVPGRMVSSGSFAGQLWDGLALIVVDESPGTRRLPEVEIANVGFAAEPLEFADAHETIRSGAHLVSTQRERVGRELDLLRRSIGWRARQAVRSLRTRAGGDA